MLIFPLTALIAICHAFVGTYQLRVLRHTHARFVELLLGVHISETVVANAIIS